VPVKKTDTISPIIEKGNSLYSRKRFDQALEAYDMALLKANEPKLLSVINFNKGAALYKKEDYKMGAEVFKKALATDDKNIEAKAYYNLGNTHYRLAESITEESVDAIIKLYETALYYYKFAVELSVDMPDAIYNYEFVKKKLDYYRIKKDLLQNTPEKPAKQQSQQGEGKQGSQQQSNAFV